MENQFVPPLVVYCHVPCVLALAVFAITATPLMLEPVSGSLNLPLNKLLNVDPAGLAVSSSIAASAASEVREGASLSALIVSLIERAVAAIAVAPPLLLT